MSSSSTRNCISTRQDVQLPLFAKFTSRRRPGIRPPKNRPPSAKAPLPTPSRSISGSRTAHLGGNPKQTQTAASNAKRQKKDASSTRRPRIRASRHHGPTSRGCVQFSFIDFNLPSHIQKRLAHRHDLTTCSCQDDPT